MYDLKMLEEIKSQEERIHFSSFDYNDAYTLGTMLRERGLIQDNIIKNNTDGDWL